jgi:uncharacterized protein YcfJ
MPQYMFKSAALDPAMLRQALDSAELGDEPNVLKFKSPKGHALSTPYSSDVVQHHITRLGGPEAYYHALGNALREHGSQADRDVEQERDMAVRSSQNVNMLGGSIFGGLGGGAVGSILGGLAGEPGAGAAIGGALGAIGGGVLGHNRHVDRDTKPVSREIDEISHLYKEPSYLKALKAKLEDMQQRQDEMDYGHYYDDDDQYYGRRRGRNPYARHGYYY